MDVTISFSLPKDARSVGAVRRLCRSALREVGASPADIDDVELIVSEAATNAVEHTGAGGFSAVIRISTASCRVQISDTGEGLRAVAGTPRKQLSGRGRGIEIMRALADRVDFEVISAGGTTVVLEKRLQPASA